MSKGRIVFIGDEVTAAGFRLAGVTCHVPDAQELPALVAAQRDACDILMMTTECARLLPATQRAQIMVWSSPLVALIPDIRGVEGPPDLAAEVRRELGIAGAVTP